LFTLLKTPLNPTDNITEFTKEEESRETPNRFPPLITSDEARNTARDMQVGHDNRDDKSGQQS